MGKRIKKIGMVVAMDKEVTPFLNSTGKAFKPIKIGGYEIFSYKVKDKKIYLIKSGIGEIYASSATEILISVLKCDIIINFGVVGSLTDDISIFQTVVLGGVVHYDFDLSPIDNTKVGEYPNMNGEVVISLDSKLIEFAKSVIKNVKVVNCASADKFVADEKVKNKLFKEFNCEVCDMEVAGVALTCKTAGVPLLSIKAVSDGKGGVDEFNKRVNVASTAYVKVINEIVDKL